MVSVVVLAKNEELTIKACLESVSWADEIIVIDDFSHDKTSAIAEALGARVFKHPLQNDFSAQRNFGLEKANGDWILFVDADERVSHSLQYEITTHVNDPMNNSKGFYVRRVDTIWGRKVTHGEVGSVTLLRLARKGLGTWKGKVHEVWEIGGKTEKLQHRLDHYPHQSVKAFLTEINYYSTLRAQELFKKRKKTSVQQIIFYPTGKFFISYFWRLGFLDGMPGLLIATMMSFHSFLVRAKLWQLQFSKGRSTV